MSKYLEETDMKMTSRRQKWCQNHLIDIMHERCLTPPHVRRHFLALVVLTEIPVGYARNLMSSATTVKILKFGTSEKLAIITLKFEQSGLTIA